MKPNNTDRNQGEGDKISARHYNRNARAFVATGSVDDAANKAKEFVEKDPNAAARAEAQAKRGPKLRSSTRVSVDELVAKGKTFLDRVSRAAGRVRARITRSK